MHVHRHTHVHTFTHTCTCAYMHPFVTYSLSGYIVIIGEMITSKQRQCDVTYQSLDEWTPTHVPIHVRMHVHAYAYTYTCGLIHTHMYMC